MILLKKYIYIWLTFFSLLNLSSIAQASVNPEDLLPAEEAFVPSVQVNEQGIQVDFRIADGYYLYQSKILAQSSAENDAFEAPKFSQGKDKEDEFFGKQHVYYQNAQANWAYKKPHAQPYKLTLMYQGCADVGVCYPPVETTFDINGTGLYETQLAAKGLDLFVKKTQGAANRNENNPVLHSSAPADSVQANPSNRFQLSWATLGRNLVAFFLAGLALSLTACMYPLLPIVSSIIVGDQSNSKKRGFLLSFVYVQGLALTYTLVGVMAGLTGALLTVWLQQAWVILTASAVMVVLALSMFGWFSIQLPASWQSYFQSKSNQLSGGKIASVFVMGMFSALIVGPCVAPPLAFALGYIGQTGDATLGGLALYILAMGTGIPLILIGTFGGHILPRAGAWMNGVKYAFGFILLAVAVYLSTPFLPYAVVASAYVLLLLAPIVMLWRKKHSFSNSLKKIALGFSAIFLVLATHFAWNSIQSQNTFLHDWLALYPPHHATHHAKLTDVHELERAIETAFAKDKNQPVLLDFYADWCVSCKQMEAKTFNDNKVQANIPMSRLIQIDVTANTAEHQALLKKYGLFGPPGLFILKADGSRSAGLLGFASPDEFIEWYQQNNQ